jgi:hypothetical protein
MDAKAHPGCNRVRKAAIAPNPKIRLSLLPGSYHLARQINDADSTTQINDTVRTGSNSVTQGEKPHAATGGF